LTDATVRLSFLASSASGNVPSMASSASDHGRCNGRSTPGADSRAATLPRSHELNLDANGFFDADELLKVPKLLQDHGRNLRSGGDDQKAILGFNIRAECLAGTQLFQSDGLAGSFGGGRGFQINVKAGECCVQNPWIVGACPTLHLLEGFELRDASGFELGQIGQNFENSGANRDVSARN